MSRFQHILESYIRFTVRKLMCNLIRLNLMRFAIKERMMCVIRVMRGRERTEKSICWRNEIIRIIMKKWCSLNIVHFVWWHLIGGSKPTQHIQKRYECGVRLLSFELSFKSNFQWMNFKRWILNVLETKHIQRLQ